MRVLKPRHRELAAIEPSDRRNRRRPFRLRYAPAWAVVIAGVAAAAMTRGPVAPSSSEATVQTNFATVKRSDLVAVRSMDGEVASQDGPSILGRLNGTITAMAPEGAKVERGQTLYEVDGQPVVLMYGSIPAWRDIGGAITGLDVKQLEENLEALGYEAGTIDETFTTSTQSAVNSWLDSLDLTEDGVVHLGRVVFAPGALTVAEHKVDVGATSQPGAELMTTVSSQKVVKATLEDSDDLTSGDEVSIDVHKGSKVPGKVTSVDESDPTDGQGGGATVATVVPNDVDALANIEDGSDVDVELITDERRDVLVVPVTALLARQNGGYAVQVQRSDGTTDLVTVRPGLYADDLVEITGDVKDGDRVVVP